MNPCCTLLAKIKICRFPQSTLLCKISLNSQTTRAELFAALNYLVLSRGLDLSLDNLARNSCNTCICEAKFVMQIKIVQTNTMLLTVEDTINLNLSWSYQFLFHNVLCQLL